jgi:hypothetical protein
MISTLNLVKTGKVHDVQDDIESFVLVVLYHILRYTGHNKTEDIPVIMKRVFDDYIVWPNGTVTGGEGKQAMFERRRYIGKDLRFTNNQPVNAWFRFAMRAVKEWQQAMDPAYDDDITDLGYGNLDAPAVPSEELLLRDHRELAKVWRKILDEPGWPVDDEATDYFPKPSRARSSKRSFREPDITEFGDSTESQPASKKMKSMSSVGGGPRTNRKGRR